MYKTLEYKNQINMIKYLKCTCIFVISNLLNHK